MAAHWPNLGPTSLGLLLLHGDRVEGHAHGVQAVVHVPIEAQREDRHEIHMAEGMV